MNAAHILAFDCTVDRFSALVTRGGEVVATCVREAGQWRGEEVVPTLAALLAEAGLDWQDLELLAVAVGPGGFTGVRTAVATARGLALAAGLPVMPVSTLEALAHEAIAALALADFHAGLVAGRGLVHLLAVRDGKLALAPRTLPLAELPGALPPGEPLVLARAERADPALLGERPLHRRSPHARGVLAAARQRLARGEPPREGFAVTPLYLRGPAADPAAGRPLVPQPA